ncbi:ras-related protein Rab-44 isoform X2 [Apodemus sylvaticus]|uniref:ras-related protein Rab-44 isoform X2 n=1 Tax=Apodemus sylvaticus TaxID=10129 RepID=UPI00224392B8|nr:ras-related protein Rab-44 isoform X2 [Apodemus sylvaticus]
MEKGKGVSRKGRKLASSRRRQAREPADAQDAPVAPEAESWPSDAAAELQAFFQDCGAKERGFVTREDLAEARFSFLGGEEPQMIFDWVDMESRGRLSLEEFSSGLNVFGSSPSTHRLRTKPSLPSQRESVTSTFPALEEADAEEKEAFLALVGQMETSHSLSEQAEIWKLWRELRQEEPQLAGNLEGFLAKMSGRLQEAWADREALAWTLRKRDSDHLHKVRQLYEETEEQIRRERQQLQAQSDSRDIALSANMQEALQAKEQEAQRLAEGQRELEAQLLHLSSTQQEASRENLQLREAERDLAGQLEEVRGQLQVTRGHLDAARTRGRVSWQIEEEPSVPRENKEAPDPQANPTEEAPLPELFGDNDDWDRLLGSFEDHSHRTLRLCWSPPPSPGGTSAPQTPRIVRQISISKVSALQFPQEPVSDSDPGPRSPAGVSPGGARDRTGVEDPKGQDGQDVISKQPVDTPDLDARPQGPFLWSLPGALAGESGNAEAAASRVLLPSEAEPPAHGLSSPPRSPTASRKQTQAPDLGDKSLWSGPDPAKLPIESEVMAEDLKLGLASQGTTDLPEEATEPFLSLESVDQVHTERPVQDEAHLARPESHPRSFQEAHGQVLSVDSPSTHLPQSLEEQLRPEEGKLGERGQQEPGSAEASEAHGLETRNTESSQQDDPLSNISQPPAEIEAPAPGQMSPPRGSPILGGGAGLAVGAPETTRALLTLAESAAQPRPVSMPVQVESMSDATQPTEPEAESRPEEPRTDLREAEPSSSPGDLPADKPQADPDYLYHVIFLGDSSVGKTSFLHLLHHDAFATGLTATVGVDFRVKNLLVDNKTFALQLWDTAGQERYHSLTRQLLRKAEGVVLMYDVTSQESFTHVRYWLDCLQDAGVEGAAMVLLGNKMDCEEERQVPTEAGRSLAQELGISFGECSAALGHNILEPMMNLARSLKMHEDRLKASLAEVNRPQPPKRAGCCR